MAQKRVLMKGNEVIAEAAIRAGCRNYFGYPITPQTEVMHYMAKKMVQVGGNFVQAESEVAAINMVYGAAAAGLAAGLGASTFGLTMVGCLAALMGCCNSTSKGMPLTLTLAMLPSTSSISTS